MQLDWLAPNLQFDFLLEKKGRAKSSVRDCLLPYILLFNTPSQIIYHFSREKRRLKTFSLPEQHTSFRRVFLIFLLRRTFFFSGFVEQFELAKFWYPGSFITLLRFLHLWLGERGEICIYDDKQWRMIKEGRKEGRRGLFDSTWKGGWVEDDKGLGGSNDPCVYLGMWNRERERESDTDRKKCYDATPFWYPDVPVV